MTSMVGKIQDIDLAETKEWLEALNSVLARDGKERVTFLLNQLLYGAASRGAQEGITFTTPYKNTILPEEEAKLPDNPALIERISAFIRWNAVMMVLRAGHKAPELGGHIATYASAATLYEIGFHYFFHAKTMGENGELQEGDCLYIQGHSSPGIYARAFLEGRLSEEQLDHFRQEVEVNGLSSYPHPWLMGDFWQFPTVSMGLGPIQAIYQARFLRYLENRKLLTTKGRRVWAFLGDGETDEVESLGALQIASRENLDNLTFVVNCNLQRLDGPVRGCGKIIQELEAHFKGCGWKVIKAIWGAGWDALLAQDSDGLLLKRMEECLDGEYQTYRAKNGAYVREHFFGKYPELLARVAHMSDDEIWALLRGGHDPQKVYAAYYEAVNTVGQPTVILAKTVKGFGMGEAGEGQNYTHQQKKMTLEQLHAFRQRFDIPIAEEEIDEMAFCRPDKDSAEMQYLLGQREKLGGFLPSRRTESSALEVPALSYFDSVLRGLGDREISTTMAFVRLLNLLLKDAHLGKLLVPIVPDECRTFGMEGLFRQIGIYSSVGQLYTPVDRDQLMYYKESQDGQILEEGLSEAGAFASWMAAGTSYSTNNFPMIPFYIYYSMFGFQRIGDLAWAAGDAKARGFLLGATSGRTTLAGEGLQHQDGQSLVLSSIIPNCVSYDPTYAYELAVIIQHGLQRMYKDQENVFFYISLMNENYVQPDMPQGAEEGIIKGMYCLHSSAKPKKLHIQLLGSGTILREVIKAAEMLEADFDVSSDIWSVTSFTELKREADELKRYQRLHPEEKATLSHVEKCFKDKKGPIIAATDYVQMYSEQIRPYLSAPYVVLGTDGYGRSDTREKLRHFFEVDAKAIALAAMKALADAGEVKASEVTRVIKKYEINAEKPYPFKS
jgi:pyruvate dehydrogenase E1 component